MDLYKDFKIAKFVSMIPFYNAVEWMKHDAKIHVYVIQKLELVITIEYRHKKSTKLQQSKS